MLLYACKTCGRWQDVSLVKSLNDVMSNVARLMNQQPPEQLGYPCSAGHGLMDLVPPDARIFVRLNEVEALPEESKE